MGQAQINVRTRACSRTSIARTKQAALTHNVRGKELSNNACIWFIMNIKHVSMSVHTHTCTRTHTHAQCRTHTHMVGFVYGYFTILCILFQRNPVIVTESYR